MEHPLIRFLSMDKMDLGESGLPSWREELRFILRSRAMPRDTGYRARDGFSSCLAAQGPHDCVETQVSQGHNNVPGFKSMYPS